MKYQFLKRFLVENPNKEEIFITEHDKSFLEIVSTDWKPVAEVVYAKIKGVQKDNQTILLEEFINVKGIKALGNQLTADKIKQITMLEPIPYELPVEEIELDVTENPTDSTGENDIEFPLNEDGQPTLF